MQQATPRRQLRERFERAAAALSVCVTWLNLSAAKEVSTANAGVRQMSSAISACERSQELGRAPQVLRALQQQGRVPNVFTCSALIGTCGKGRQPGRAAHVLRAMRQHLVVPKVATYSTLISTCEKGRQPE